MALTPAEIVAAESDYIDGDGSAFQFSRSAILGFIRDRLNVRAVAHSGNMVITLTEEGAPKNAADFANFQIDLANSTIQIDEDGAAADTDTLNNYSEASGIYTKAYTASGPVSVTVLSVIRCSFTNPTTLNNPTATESFDIPYFEAVSGAGTAGQRVIKAFSPTDPVGGKPVVY